MLNQLDGVGEAEVLEAGVLEAGVLVVVVGGVGTTVPEAYRLRRPPAPQNSEALPLHGMLHCARVTFVAPVATALAQ